MIKRHDEYTFDEILDKYNETKDTKFLSYAFIKANDLDVIKVMSIYELRFEVCYMYIYNIQRELDGLKPVTSIQQIGSIIQINDNDIIDDDDYDDYDF